MKKHRITLFLLLVTVTAFSQLAPGKPSENGISAERLGRVDQMIGDQINKKMIPGAVVMIVRNGKVIYNKAYGFSDLESQAAMKTNDIFRMASQTKAITSLAVMMLFEEGKFLLDDPISAYIPEFKSPKVMVNLNWADTTYTTVPAKSEITIRQLLTHSSGIDYASIGSQEMRAIYAKAGVTAGIGDVKKFVLADKIKVLGGLPLKHQPGEAFTYGLNTDVLGYLVEVLSGMSLDQFFKSRIFQPMGMNDTYFYIPKEKHSRLVPLYTVNKGVLEKAKPTAQSDMNYPLQNGTYFSGGGGLSGTIEDYAKFLQLFLNKGEFNGVRLLSRKTIELMLTNQLQPPIINQWGLGFELETINSDYRRIASMGTFSWGGAFATDYWADPKEKLIGLIYTNMYGSPSRGRSAKFQVLTFQAIVD